ncbi:Sugar phosphate permease [Amycolatopsis sacchari]|uniref:Sugar phosphate permease n=1 Tax=Amycolatopsis sacchari TaxID=115433 RepID=A0A1I3RH38_9PSEU|nr:MFS transporter [Amycolatopsis sacchari]SFJ45152.1 Sugar phosphate permease [Amycolatopsis sacchari]
MSSEPPTSTVRSATRKAALRIVPLVAVMYVISYVDRVNVGFAAQTMNPDLGLSTAAYGLGAGLFFIGYVLFEVPSNVVLHRVGARRWLARIMVSWGVVSGAMAFVGDETQFYVVRVLLGLAEAGFVPGVVYLLTTWFPAPVRARMIARFIVAIPFAVVLGAPVSALLISHGDGFLGLAGWRTMFLVEALPAVVVGVVAYFALPSTPERASWLTAGEREALVAALRAEEGGVGEHGRSTVLAALRDWRIYVVSLIGFASNIGGYALSFFLPQVIAELSRRFGNQVTLGRTALLTAIPYAVAAVALLLVARSSDRRQERHFHAAVPLVAGAVAVAGALYLPSTALVLVAISVAAAGSYSVLPVFWQLPPRFLTGAAVAAGMGVAGGLANVAGFLAPYVTGALHDATGSYRTGMFVVAAVMLAGAVAALALRKRPEFRNQPVAKTVVKTGEERA